MTVEIKHLLIKTSVLAPQPEPADRMGANQSQKRPQEDMLKQCERLVREILNEERER
jgi:hypothetical protein